MSFIEVNMYFEMLKFNNKTIGNAGIAGGDSGSERVVPDSAVLMISISLSLSGLDYLEKILEKFN